MTLQAVRGSRVPLDAVYRDASDNLVDPVTPLVDIINPANVAVVTDAVPVRSSLGLYDYPGGGYLLAEDAPLGIWTARWTGTVDGDPVQLLGEFEVIAAYEASAGASALDVLTLAEAKQALNIDSSNTTQDVELAGYITAMSLRLDRLVGPIVRRTVTDEVHDGGRSMIFLHYPPVDSVTTVSERVGATATAVAAENYASSTANDYVLTSASGVLRRRVSGGDTAWAAGRHNIVVTYVAGRFADTASVDERFKTAAKIMLNHLWRHEQGVPAGPYSSETGVGIPTFAVPRAVREMLADELPAPAVA